MSVINGYIIFSLSDYRNQVIKSLVWFNKQPMYICPFCYKKANLISFTGDFIK